MKKNYLQIFILTLFLNSHVQSLTSQVICFTNQTDRTPDKEINGDITKKKIVRINYHFMLKSNGTGNFTEITDGDGRVSYNGYKYAKDVTQWMNERCTWNEKMNIPPGNNTPNLPKNISFVLDAVYFWRNDNVYNFRAIYDQSYPIYGKDRDSVLNIFLSYHQFTYPEKLSVGGYAASLNPNSKIKYTENRGYWQQYLNIVNNGGYIFNLFNGTGANTLHELFHLLGLSHTVRWNGSAPCPTGCPGFGNNISNPINTNCDDGCDDTPTAWEIMQLNNCAYHPDYNDDETRSGPCGWGNGNNPYCSNNIMDYNGHNALTPCQLEIIHSSLEGGMKSYLTCEAVTKNIALCDIGYPKLAYFGKNITIGCQNQQATITNGEEIQLYYSQSVELSNFEIRSDCTFEVFIESPCTF